MYSLYNANPQDDEWDALYQDSDLWIYQWFSFTDLEWFRWIDIDIEILFHDYDNDIYIDDIDEPLS